MEFHEGEKVVYTFPKPVDGARKQFYGEIFKMTEGWIFIKSEDDVVLKVSFNNIELLTKAGDKKKAI